MIKLDLNTSGQKIIENSEKEFKLAEKGSFSSFIKFDKALKERLILQQRINDEGIVECQLQES